MKYDYVVIGGGISGMTTALILAKQGFSTALLEKSARLAPTVRGFTRNNLYFDTGFHYAGGLSPEGPLDIFFRYLGLTDIIEKKPFREDGFDIFHCVDPRYDFAHPWGYDRIKKGFDAAFPGEGRAIDAYFSAAREQFHSIPYVNLDLAENSLAPSPQSEITLQAFLDGLTTNRLLKCILSMHCFLHGVAPDEVSFAQHAWVAGSYYESAYGIVGGGSSLTEALTSQLKMSGVDIYTGSEAEKIRTGSDGSLCSVALKNDKELACRGCVSTIHPGNLLAIAPDSVFRPAYVKRLRDLEETPSAAIVYAACSRPLPMLDGTNIYLFPEPDFSFLHKNLPLEKRPMYITSAGNRGDNTGNQHGFIAISPMSQEQARPLMDESSKERSARYEDLKKEIADTIMASIASAYPDMAAAVSNITCATPLTLKDYTNSPHGSLYGAKHMANQVNPLPVTRLTGLFLAGQAVTAPGIMGAMMSAFLACGSIVGHEKLRKELKACR